MFFKQGGGWESHRSYLLRYAVAVSPGALIRRARAEADLTQQALAERAGTSQAALSAYEHERKDPTAATLFRILAAAGARLTTTPAPVVVTPSRETLRERGRILEAVIELAEALPARQSRELNMPPLATLIEDPRG